MNNNLPRLFLIISLIFGTLLIFIIPSFNAPDEDSHFLYSYEISRGDLIPKEKNGVSGYNVPNSIFNNILETKLISENRDSKYTYSQMYLNQLVVQDYSKETFSNSVVKNSPKIVYLAPALGIEVAKLSNFHRGTSQVSAHVLLQYARFFSLLIYSIIGYFAIKIIPVFKKSFFAVLLLPVSLFLRSVVSYDGILLVILALTFANMLKLIHDENSKYTKKDMILFVICGFILLNIKTIYAIAALALFAIPKERFKDNKKIKTIIKLCIYILILSILQRIPYMFVNMSGDENFGEQLQFVKTHPLGYLKILAKNIIGQRKIQEYWMLGTFGNLETYMPVLFVFLLKVYLFFVFTIDVTYEKIILPIWLKIGYFLLIIFDICGMYTMMYLSWTPKVSGVFGGSEITGVQGRYYLPFLLFIPLIFSNNLFDKIIDKLKLRKIIDKFKLIFDNNFHYITVTSLVLVVVILFMRYYC